jgi:isopentenyl-diphosphate delta-isomerase
MNTSSRAAPVNIVSVEDRVILVDASDRALGTEEKLRAHESGALHRAFSVFVIDDDNRVLLQQRATTKYHSAGLWSNTCCGHPRPGEETRTAAARRLVEEMQVACDLVPAGRFLYRAQLGNGLVEHELDHLFIGRFTADPTPAPEEVDRWTWMAWPALVDDCARHPDRYTAWLPKALAALGDPWRL